jgi:hypothetical protein
VVTPAGFDRAKVEGRPRSDYLVAPGLWAAIDEHDCQIRQNRQNAVVVDATGGSVRFDGFDGHTSDAHEPDVATDTQDQAGMGQPPSGILLLAAPVVETQAAIPASEQEPERDPLKILMALRAKQKLVQAA